MNTKKSTPEAPADSDEALDVPLLSRQGTYRDPNTPLPLDVEKKLRLTANHFVSNRTLVLGQSGYGKGNAGALIMEFLLEAGLPATFIDLEGECWSFKEVCANLLVVGRSAHADREYSPAQMGRLAELSVEQEFSVVLDFSGFEDEEIFALLLPYLRGLWAACERLRKPYHLVADELHEVAPEEGSTPVKGLLRRIAKRGRKRGLGFIGMSQETASVDKKIIRQTDIRILLRVSYTADLATYHTLIPKVTLEMVKETVPAFPKGTAYVIVDHQATLVQLHRRRTYDPSETPKLGQRAAEPALRALDTATLQLLDEALPVAPGEETPLERLDRASLISLLRDQHRQPDTAKQLHLAPGEQQRLRELQEELRQKQARIDQLEAQIRASQSKENGTGSAPALHIGELHHQIETAQLSVNTFQETSPSRKNTREAPGPEKQQARSKQEASGTRAVPAHPSPAPSILKTEAELLARQVKRVENLWSLEKRILRWLLEHPNVAYTLTELSKRTGIPRGHLYARNLARLGALDFVVKGNASPKSYAANLSLYWQLHLASYADFQLVYQPLWQATQE